MHSFAISFTVRAQGDGTVAAISGSILAAKRETKRTGQREFESITLNPGPSFIATIAVRNGKWTYSSGDGAVVRTETNSDLQWHDIVLSHYTARGETLFFVDGKLAGKVAERLQPNRFVLGGPGSAGSADAPRQADYKDLFVFRSALNSDEAAALHERKLLQASLEIYAPLNDAEFRQDMSVENRGQSLAAFKVGTGRIVHGN
jgi:hypothetical protein